jgi:signal transduction histidine kinase
MTSQSAGDDSTLSVAFTPTTPRHRKAALGFSLGIVGAFVAIASVGLVQLPRSDGFLPAVQGIIAATDFITAVLLFGQYAIDRSRALWMLASGYLFAAFIVVAHTLTFPGAFTPTGLFGAGPQTAAWLYVVWHVTVPAAAIAYVLMKSRPVPAAGVHMEPGIAIRRTVIVLIVAACAITWALVAARDALPTLIVSETRFAATARLMTALPMVLSVLGLGLLWRRRTSVLDEWLLVAMVASLAETALVVYLGASRYTLPFYASRPLAVVAASAVLVALLSEMTRLYVRLSIALRAQQRERANKLMNLDVVVGTIAHEIRQPLMVITTCSTIIENLLRKPTVDVDDVKLNLDDMKSSSVRIAETSDGLRSLFKGPREARQPIDVNKLALESLEILVTELSGHAIAVRTELAAGLPAVVGHRGQLREVFVNLVQNAIDALTPLADRARTLLIRTSYTEPNRVSVTIADSGVGIEPDRLPNLFMAAVTTKERGMGLGLGLCQMIVDRHNGQLAVSSDLGKGTRFEVTLPCELPAAVESPRVQPGAVNADA